ncbi:MAG: nucleoside-diphosphate kinase [Coriobacteriales bacterium]|nr:nucleoside-diphosphate kinase [Coriobacteriales bacterium]
MAIEKTYSMIKPNAVAAGHVGEIITRFERSELTIERIELATLTPEQVKLGYEEHEGKPFYPPLIEFMLSGPVVKMVISGENAVARCREIMGATDPEKAEPGTIRADFGTSVRENAIHGSDSPESAAREISIYFG